MSTGETIRVFCRPGRLLMWFWASLLPLPIFPRGARKSGLAHPDSWAGLIACNIQKVSDTFFLSPEETVALRRLGTVPDCLLFRSSTLRYHTTESGDLKRQTWHIKGGIMQGEGQAGRGLFWVLLGVSEDFGGVNKVSGLLSLVSVACTAVQGC